MAVDYKNLERGSVPEQQGGLGFWWKLVGDDSDIARAVTAAAGHLQDTQTYRTQDNLRHARLYGNIDFVGFGPRQYARSLGFGPAVNRIALNAVAACIDTLQSKICKNRPKPSFQTFGGDWKLQQKAKKLDKFCQGQFYETKLYEHGAMAMRDAMIFGTGCVKFSEQNGRICAERILIEELKVDDADGIYGTPRQLFQSRMMHRSVLMDLFGDTEERIAAIAQAKSADEADSAARAFGDMVTVTEAWHLPSGEKTGDGKHVIACDNVLLFKEEWTKTYFPFAFMKYVKRVSGFFGQGIPERLFGIQLEINRLIREIAETMRLMSKGRALVEVGSKVVKSHLDSSIGAILEYVGTKPEIWAPNAVPPEQFAQLDRLWTRAFEHEGISQLSASAKKPSGLDAAVALREYNDIESERFALVGQAYETFYLDAARIMIDLAKDIAGDGGDYKVNAPIRKSIEPVKWSEIKLEEDMYLMQAFPVSSLPSTPAARRQEVTEWIQQGWVDAVEGRKLMNMPDLENSDSLAVAALDDADATIEAILDGEDFEAPDKFQNLQLLMSRGISSLLRGRRQGAPASALQELENFLDLVADKIQQAQPPPAPPGPPMPGGPAGPGAPPAPPMPPPGA